jgi:hypothetical protein
VIGVSARAAAASAVGETDTRETVPCDGFEVGGGGWHLYVLVLYIPYLYGINQ